MNNRHKIALIALLFAIISVALLLADPIAQDPNYHNFADKRALFGVNNFGDVASNIPYLIVGILGLLITFKFRKDRTKFIKDEELLQFVTAFLGIFFVGLGSGYYHLNPTNQTLVWDRLPMTVGFMAIFSIIISERINFKFGLRIMPLLLVLGIASIIYWNQTEELGHGDLRPYALVQFFPLLAIPLIITLFPAKYTGTRYLGELVIWYLIAKLLEHFDSQIFELTNFTISGHTLKHLASAIATYSLVRFIKFRRRIKN